ncbi:MAG TPA: hypothetical protein VKD45_09190, partial [Hyphomicrobiaceae bacterium]|nr:hypothetical protein [Hyphomicrobiaceae bacterium]
NRFMSIFSPEAFVTLDLPAGQFPPFTPWIWATTLTSSVALVGFALLRSRRHDANGASSILLASPSRAPWPLPSPGSTTTA